MEHQELLSGFIRLHVLHHAAEGDLYGQWMIEELARHGYRVSPGTLYPMLHAMEHKMSGVDKFVVITDNETWAGRTQPVQALAQYRQRFVETPRS